MVMQMLIGLLEIPTSGFQVCPTLR